MSKSQVSVLAKNLDLNASLSSETVRLTPGPARSVWLDTLFHKVHEGGRVV